MINKNITITITEFNGPELIPLMNVKSSTDRNIILIETNGVAQIAVNIKELQDAITIVETFSKDNPAPKSADPKTLTPIGPSIDEIRNGYNEAANLPPSNYD